LFTASLLVRKHHTVVQTGYFAAGLEAVPCRLGRVTGAERFTFRFADAYRRPARLFGVTPETAWVDLGADTLRARFGPWRVTTPLANIGSVAVTAGPARLAITDRGLTFATNGQRGVLISFRSPVRGLDPLGLLRHSELTVTVADVDGLAKRLRLRGT
jgi:hypothetical protein